MLTALAEGRVPEVRPNYEYFSQLLALQSAICVRPKTCEVFVSSSDIKMRDDVAYDAHDAPLDQALFPHLNKYSGCDDSPNVLGKDVLLHEYTRSLDRTTSACVKAITRRWQKDAPAMYETLDLPTRDEDCLLMEICATIELHEHGKFPSGSELTGFVEVAVTQPALQQHRWKCVTRLTRPAELGSDDGKQAVYTNESGIHRRGCSDSKTDCDCHTRPRLDIHVPFPAVEWASILSMAVQYPDVEHQRVREKRRRTADGDKELERAGSKRKRSEDEGDAASWSRREPTGSDLICKVAMYQELWSCAPDSTQWTRQAIVFWRFNTTNQWHKYSPVFKPAGTTWRWLTMNDPMSRYHQQKALVYLSPGVTRDAVMSPMPTINQHLTAMSETFSSAWDAGHGHGHGGGGGGVPAVPPLQTSANGLSLFESFPGGLATPPPTATLPGPYSMAGSFDAAGVGFLPASATTGTPTTATTPGGAGAVGDRQQQQQQQQAAAGASAYFDSPSAINTAVGPYMAATSALDMPSQLVYDGSPCDTGNMQGWDMAALDGWAGSASAPASATTEWGPPGKLDTQGDQAMWAPHQWPLSAGAAPASHERGGSPRPMKRRRETTDSHVPVTAGW